MRKYLDEKSGKDHTDSEKESMSRYLKETSKASIATEITIRYNLPWDFDHVKLVDTPGVNAIGGIASVTEGFISSADAILFVLHPQNVHAKSFKDFVKTSTEKNKAHTYLVLTHSSDKTSEDRTALLKEAEDNYPEMEQRVFMLDSIYQSIYWDSKSGKSEEEIERLSEKKGDKLLKLSQLSKRDSKNLAEIAAREANFEPMYNSLKKLSQEGSLEQLNAVLKAIKLGYENMCICCKNRLELLESKLESPQEFSAKIEKKNKQLEELILEKNNKIRDTERKYQGGNYNSESHRLFLACIDKYKSIIQKISTKKDPLPMIKKNWQDCVDELKKVDEVQQNKLTQHFNGEFNHHGHKSITPIFDFKSINESAIKDAEYEKETTDTIYHQKTGRFWYTLWLYKETYTEEEKVKRSETVVNETEYYEGLIREVIRTIDVEGKEIAKELYDGIYDSARKMLEEYKTRSTTNEDKLKKEWKDLLKKQADIQEVVKESDQIKVSVSAIDERVNKITDLSTNLN